MFTTETRAVILDISSSLVLSVWWNNLLILAYFIWVFLKSIHFSPVSQPPPSSFLTVLKCTPLDKQRVRLATQVNIPPHQGQLGSGVAALVLCPHLLQFSQHTPKLQTHWSSLRNRGVSEWMSEGREEGRKEGRKEGGREGGRDEWIIGKEQRRVAKWKGGRKGYNRLTAN